MIAVIDYGMGNVGSVLNMLKKAGAEAVVTSDPQIILGSQRLVLPGVGAFDQGMRNLQELKLVDVLQEKVVRQKTPILGICLGLQLLTRKSQEGERPGLGWIPAETVRFQPEKAKSAIRIPHMGWNTVTTKPGDPLFAGLETDNRFYFVHSFHLVCDRPEDVIGRSFYGYDFDSAVRHEHIMGTQFHPEKSHRFGMRLVTNFVRGA